MNTDQHRFGIRVLLFAFYLCSSVFVCGNSSFADEPKPKVAVFPLGGDAKPEAREKIGFSMRAKIDREGTYEPIDGPTMADLVGELTFPVDTKLDQVEKFAKDADADVMIWGQLDAAGAGYLLKVKVFDRRQLDPLPHVFEKQINEPTDMRFVVEEILQTLADMKAFEHPNEVAVQHDAMAEKLWAENPNLVINGTFDDAANWDGIYQAEKYAVKFTDAIPNADKIAIYRMPLVGDHPNNVLAMNLSKNAAENNGLACLSDAIAIDPKTRYRLSFRYKSDGPVLHVFVKGYTLAKNLKGEMVDRECYRRQVPPSGETNGEWVTIIDELNPQHVVFPVQKLRIDLYAYLKPGTVMFDDIVLKAVGGQTRIAKDAAIKPPASMPVKKRE